MVTVKVIDVMPIEQSDEEKPQPEESKEETKEETKEKEQEVIQDEPLQILTNLKKLLQILLQNLMTRKTHHKRKQPQLVSVITVERKC